MDYDSGQGSAWASANDADSKAVQAQADAERLGQILFDFITGGATAVGEAEMDFLTSLSARAARRENDRLAYESRMKLYQQGEIERVRAQAAAAGGLGGKYRSTLLDPCGR